MVAMRLSKAGYGRVDEILEMRTDLVVAMIAYEEFSGKYQEAFYEINKPKGNDR